MLKILINESDLMFHYGMKYFLSDFFGQHFMRTPEFFTDYTHENIANADVIILSLRNGERYTCIPGLKMRRQGIIIGLVDDIDTCKRSPACFEDMIFIQRRESLSSITQKFTIAWKNWLMREAFPCHKTCQGCNNFKLSFQQREIMVRLYQGRSVQEVATSLHISYKTVASHKYNVMRKFSLKNDHELFRFLSMLSQKNETRLSL
ncbi:response regulator transcription factor [Enterobacter sp. A4]|uniref:helix-turn-helix transcriptional regulator n=1 Tax=Enterobacter TaxID=547 RepID=UPI003D1CA3CC